MTPTCGRGWPELIAAPPRAASAPATRSPAARCARWAWTRLARCASSTPSTSSTASRSTSAGAGPRHPRRHRRRSVEARAVRKPAASASPAALLVPVHRLPGRRLADPVPQLAHPRAAGRRAWRAAVSAVVDRHESLRTGFVLRDGEPVQVVMPAAGIDTELIDLRDLPADEAGGRGRAARLPRRTHPCSTWPTDPLVGSCLLRLADDHHVWCFTMHHLLADGASLRIVGREMRAATSAVRASPSCPLSMQYGDFAAVAGEQDQAADLAYWREQLDRVPAAGSADRPSAARREGAEQRRAHPPDGPEARRRVVELARRSPLHPVHGAAGGAAGAAGQRSGQDDFCVGTPVAGRVRAEFEPRRRAVRQHPGAARRPVRRPDLPRAAQAHPETVIGASAAADRPVRTDHRRAGPAPRPGPNPAVPIIFSMRNDNATQPQLGPLRSRASRTGTPRCCTTSSSTSGASTSGPARRHPLRHRPVQPQHNRRPATTLREPAAGHRRRPPRPVHSATLVRIRATFTLVLRPAN